MKKNIWFILFISVVFISNVRGQEGKCNPDVMKKAMSQLDSESSYLIDFQVHLDAQTGEEPPVEKYSMVLKDSTIYQFSIASSDEYPGKAIFQLYEDNRLIGSTYNAKTGKAYETFNFKCQKTAIYHMFISFIDGQEGCAVGILSVKERLYSCPH